MGCEKTTHLAFHKASASWLHLTSVSEVSKRANLTSKNMSPLKASTLKSSSKSLSTLENFEGHLLALLNPTSCST